MPYAQKTKYRITLEIEAMDDFNPHQIDWEKLFELQGDEKVESYIEDLSSKYDSLWWLCEVSIENSDSWQGVHCSRTAPQNRVSYKGGRDSTRPHHTVSQFSLNA